MWTCFFKVNKKYILTVSKYSTPNRMMLGTYHEPTTANLNRFKKYDCSCKVEVNIPASLSLENLLPLETNVWSQSVNTTVILTRATAPDDHLTVMDRGHLVNGLLLPHRVLNNQTDNIRLVEYYFTRIKRIAWNNYSLITTFMTVFACDKCNTMSRLCKR